MEKGCVYELCIAYQDADEEGMRMRNIGLNSNASISSDEGLVFCNLGIYNIRFKGYFKPKVAQMPTSIHELFS